MIEAILTALAGSRVIAAHLLPTLPHPLVLLLGLAALALLPCCHCSATTLLLLCCGSIAASHPHLYARVAQPARTPKVRAVEQRLQLPRRRRLLRCGRQGAGGTGKEG